MKELSVIYKSEHHSGQHSISYGKKKDSLAAEYIPVAYRAVKYCVLIVSFFYPKQIRECPVNKFCSGQQSMYARSHQLQLLS